MRRGALRIGLRRRVPDNWGCRSWGVARSLELASSRGPHPSVTPCSDGCRQLESRHLTPAGLGEPAGVRFVRTQPFGSGSEQAARLPWPCSSVLGRGTCAPRQPHDAVGRTHVSTTKVAPGYDAGLRGQPLGGPDTGSRAHLPAGHTHPTGLSGAPRCAVHRPRRRAHETPREYQRPNVPDVTRVQRQFSLPHGLGAAASLAGSSLSELIQHRFVRPAGK
jgi:hypothetical protein